MAKLRTYHIGLEVDATDATNATLKGINESFQKINKTISQTTVSGLERELQTLQNTLKANVKSTEDAEAATKTYNNAVKKAVSELEKEATTLSYMLTEQGKQDRKRLKELEQKNVLTREEQKELKQLQKVVIKGSDEELKALLATNKQKRVRLKLSSEELRVNLKQEKTLKLLIRDDLDGLKKRIKLQMEYIKSLKTTEGRYKLLKKAGKFAGKAALGAAGIGLGIVAGAAGAAFSSAETLTERDKQAKRIKGSFTQEEKRNILEQVYVATGSTDNAAIVSAVNNVTAILKSKNADDIIHAAAIEMKYPGSAVLLQGSESGGQDIKDWNRVQRRYEFLQRRTGASIEDLTKVMDMAKSSRLVNRGELSQNEYVSLFTTLQQSGAFLDDKQIGWAITSFARQRDKSKDIYSEFDKFAASGGFRRFVRGQQRRNILEHSLDKLDTEEPGWVKSFKELQARAGIAVKETASEKTARIARQLQIKRDEIFAKIIVALEPLFNKLNEWLSSGKFDKIINGLASFLEWLGTNLSRVVGWIEAVGKWFADDDNDNDENQPTTKESQLKNAQQKSSGGIAIGPSIVGERGNELILPLDFARTGRTKQIINNFNQTFNMGESQTTASSLAFSIKQTNFAHSYLGGRL